MALAYLVPGAGHLYLGRRERGIAFFCIVVFMFAIGLAVDGDLYAVTRTGGSLLRLLAAFGSMGAGLLYWIADFRGVTGDITYPFQMAPGFVPFRKDVEYFASTEVAIQPLLSELEFTRGKSNWGYKFRFGHFELSESDFLLIARRMLPEAWQAHTERSLESAVAD